MADRNAGFGRHSRGLGPRLFLSLFGLPFLAAGLGFLWFAGINPLVSALRAQAWPQVTCTILESEVHTRTDTDGTTYRPHIVYAYVWTGTRYTSDRATVLDRYTSARDATYRLVNNHPVGTTRRCYVQPGNPEHAILDATVPGAVWFVIPLASVFVAVGGGFLLGGLGVLPKRHPRRKPSLPESRDSTEARKRQALPDYDPADRDYRSLQPDVGPTGKFLGSLLIALIWNGIISVFVVQIIKDFQRGNSPWFLLLFLSIFAVVGLFLLGLAIYQFLGLFNPRYRLTAEPGLPRLGETVRISYRSKGNFRRIGRLVITLEGREIARYRQGTNTRTLNEPFYRQVLFDGTDPHVFGAGSLEALIPTDRYPTFEAKHNEVVWQIRIEGDIVRWPDVDSTYPLTVLFNPEVLHARA